MKRILDCTTRDGGHVTNWSFSDEFVQSYIEYLNKLDVSYFEIGYRNGKDYQGKGRFYRCMPDIIYRFAERKNNLKIGVMVDTKRFVASDFMSSKDDCIDFVRLATHPQDIGTTLSVAEYLHQNKYNVFVQLMDISNVDENGFKFLENWVNKDILESLYFADSYGVLEPIQIEKFFNIFSDLGYDRISFHGHNANNLALENSLKALECGAYSIDVTNDGGGRYGGNLPIGRLMDFI